MADEAGGEVGATVVYEVSQFVDTQGREVARLTPGDHELVGTHTRVHFRGKGVLVAGQARVPFMFEIPAESVAEAFAGYDACCDEAGEKLGCEMRKAALASGVGRVTKIDEFRAQRMKRFGGNGG